MEKSDSVFVQHIKDAIKTIVEHIGDVNRDEFLKNKLLQDAVIREIEIVGEASNRLSSGFHESNKHVPWDKIIGMRNMLIHGYFEVDLEEVWKTIQKDIPELGKALSEK
ncbi:MAG: hypothetical protein CEN90_221 [Parcubacteria group bacterium Licking1014_17]|nr:MAG: hypothetical protein CEN90_221 [Parcubacteria group bacterium Licking1014_17]